MLEASTSFTTDENVCLDYHLNLLADTDQPLGKKGRFTREDLASFIVSTEKKYCLVTSKPPGLQLLHSAFMWGDWVYTSASTSETDNYWMRIPIKALLVPMVGLDFKLWRKEGSPVAGRKMPTFQGLANMSSSFPEFLNKNKLRKKPVNLALKSSRPGSATLISGVLYALLVQHVGSTENEPGFFVKIDNTLLALQ
mmetsp:Transcript_50014/g.50858  ORF Transcript_50014/g.50858 Transcript_50014/m.50858 type:complete len:196 (+) Transcript_50014:312-899(+)